MCEIPVSFVCGFPPFHSPSKGSNIYQTQTIHDNNERIPHLSRTATTTKVVLTPLHHHEKKLFKKMAKGATKAGAILVRVVSTLDTGFFYVKRKNPKKMPNKLEFRKYDPRARKHCLFVESKQK